MHPIPDLVQNVVLFIPFGYFGYLALFSDRRLLRARFVIAIAIMGFALSFCVEAMQTMSSIRFASVSDLATNTIGATLGALAGWIYARSFRHYVRKTWTGAVTTQPGLLIIPALFGILVIVMLAPFVPTLDVGNVRGQLRFILLDPFAGKAFGSLLADAVLFAGLGYAMTRELPRVMLGRGWLDARDRNYDIKAQWLTALVMACVALGFEFLQFLFVHHQPMLVDAGANVVGGLTGVTVAGMTSRGRLRPASAPGDVVRQLPALVLTFAIAAPTLRALDPLILTSINDVHIFLQNLTWDQFLPFMNLFRNLNFATFFNVFEAASVYVILGYSLRALGKRPAVCFCWALLLAELLEVLQISIVGRTFDLTEGLLATTGALVGALAYDRFTRYRSLTPDSLTAA